MKKSYVYFLIIFFFSCHNENGNAILKADLSKKVDQVKPVLTNSQKKENTIISPNNTDTVQAGAPAMTTLPFGFKPNLRNFRNAESYFIAMLSQNQSDKMYNRLSAPRSPKRFLYKLPPIKSIEYIPSLPGSWIDTGVCKDGKSFGDYINLKGYQYRLPDIYNYQCYYRGGFHYQSQSKDYSYDVFQNCSLFIDDYEYGYFILYAPKTLTAKVFTIYWDTEYDELAIYRFFYIDKAYNIQTYDAAGSLDLEGKPNQFSLTTISILPTGEIVRKKN